jgi:L-lactate dehydrogenase complex protein LldG
MARQETIVSDAREETFALIRRALGVTGREETRRDAVGARLREHPAGPIPRRGAAGDRVATFRAEAERAGALVAFLRAAEEAPAYIASRLISKNFPCRVRIGRDPRLIDLPWSDAGIEVSIGPSCGDDACALSRAFAGVAETGTLALPSGAEAPTTLNFLPEEHIVLIDGGDIVASFEEVWAKLRAAFGDRRMPSALNLVTGPSRSADIEQTLLLGAHGPGSLLILLVTGD